MRSKWLIPILIFVGAVLLLLSSTLNHSSVSEKANVWLKIAGLIILMIGLYKASKRSTIPHKENKDDEEG